MKKLLFVIVTVLLCVGISAKEKNNEKEEAAIKQVIQESTNAYRARNFNKLEATFVQDETVTKVRSSKTGFGVINGWEDISGLYKQNFTNNPEPVIGKLEKVNYKIKVYGESAWAMHDEIQDGANQQVNKQIIVHFLEKHDDKWKIVFMSQIFASSYDVAE
jgi:ketosteroid isomerase-like protein